MTQELRLFWLRQASLPKIRHSPVKLFYVDVETTGKYANKNDIIQLAYIIEIDGLVAEEGNLFMAPIDESAIEDEALAVSGSTRAQILAYPPAKEVYKKFIAVLNKYVNRYDKTDKFYPVGYNVRFDCDFISAWFRKMGDKYYGSWFWWQLADPMMVLHFLAVLGKLEPLVNYKLATVCECYGIKIDAHDAMSDIRAVRALVQKLDKVL